MSKFENVKVVFYTALWCQPCKAVKPIVEKACESREVRLEIVDVEQYPEVAVEYGVRGVPTLSVYQEGQLIFQATSAPSISKIGETLDSLV